MVLILYNLGVPLNLGVMIGYGMFNVISYFLLNYFTSALPADEVRCVLLVDLCFPIVGTILILTFFTLLPILKKFSEENVKDPYHISFEDKNFNIYLEQKKEEAHKLYRIEKSETLYDAFQIEPYVDILQGNSVELKLDVIDRLSNEQSTESVSLLKMALEDNTYEVRYFAKNSLSKIEDGLYKEIESLSEDIEANPFSPAGYKLRGRVYLKIFEMNLVDHKTAELFLKKAVYDSIYSLQLDPTQEDLIVTLVWLYLCHGDYQQAITIVDQALTQGNSHQAKLLFYRAEAHYRLKNVDQLRNDCHAVIKLGSPHRLINTICQGWLNQGLPK